MDNNWSKKMKKQCVVCGKVLNQPIAKPRNLCKRCEERDYWGRIAKRHLITNVESLKRFELYYFPCFCCSHFRFAITETPDMFQTFVCTYSKTIEERFIFPDIGGYCVKLNCMVDGNKALLSKECHNKHFKLSNKKKVQPYKIIQTELKL